MDRSSAVVMRGGVGLVLLLLTVGAMVVDAGETIYTAGCLLGMLLCEHG